MANDLWRTPPEVISFIQSRFGEIMIDLCASKDNKVCDFHLNESDNFLKPEWLDYPIINSGDLCWLNPPYSNPLPFIKQAGEWAASGYAVAGILNHDTSTKWFCELLKHSSVLMPIVGGRISFLNERGDPIKGNNKAQVMFYMPAFGAKHCAHTEYVSVSDIYK